MFYFKLKKKNKNRSATILSQTVDLETNLKYKNNKAAIYIVSASHSDPQIFTTTAGVPIKLRRRSAVATTAANIDNEKMPKSRFEKQPVKK